MTKLNLIEIFAIVVVGLLLGVMGYTTLKKINRPEKQKNGQTPTVSLSVVDGYWMRTVKHDDHLFVTWSSNGIIHHPGCPKCFGVEK